MRIILTELAWAAGFFDGEGCTSVIHNGGGRLYPQVSINQVDRRPLDRFAAAVGGGKLYPVKPTPTKVGTRSGWRLGYGPSKSIGVLGLLWPFLSEPKREQIAHVSERISTPCA